MTTHKEHEASEPQSDEVVVAESADVLSKINVIYCLLREAPTVL